MAYIPKSRIKENQFTPGNEWFYVKDNSPYTGYFYELPNGKAYTGKDQNSPPNDEIVTQKFIASTPEVPSYQTDDGGNLIRYIDNYDGFVFENQTQHAEDIRYYSILKNTDYNLYRSSPTHNPTFPTSEDYIKGQYVRYFVCKINQLEYLEVSKLTYDNINTQNGAWAWEDYIPFTLDWYIKGDVDRTFKNNRGTIFIKEKEIKRKGLNQYLQKQYLEYFEYESANNLNALEGELITYSGKDYVGSYHIHPQQGPMEGAFHTSSIHKKLFYKRFYRGRIVDSLNQEGVIETGETQRIEFTNDLTIEYNPPQQSNEESSTGGGY